MQQNGGCTPLNSTDRNLIDLNQNRNEFSNIEEMQTNYMIFNQQRKYMESEEVAVLKTINQKHETALNISEYQEENLYQSKGERKCLSKDKNDDTIESCMNKNKRTNSLKSKQQISELSGQQKKPSELISKISQSSSLSQSSYIEDEKDEKLTQVFPKGQNQENHFKVQIHQNNKINQILKNHQNTNTRQNHKFLKVFNRVFFLISFVSYFNNLFEIHTTIFRKIHYSQTNYSSILNNLDFQSINKQLVKSKQISLMNSKIKIISSGYTSNERKSFQISKYHFTLIQIQANFYFIIYSFVLPKIKKFYFSHTLCGKTQSLTSQMRKIIGDKSDEQIRGKDIGILSTFVKKLLNILDKIGSSLYLNKIPLFNPENIFKIIFNIVTVTFSCFYLFMVTLKIFFLADLGYYGGYLHTTAEIVWVLEMIVQMNTAMYHKNQFTKDRRVIMNIYLKEYFFFEILPLIFENFKPENEIILLLFKLPLILKMKGININLQYIEFYILQKLENHTFLFLLKLIFSLLLFAHLLACSYSSLNAISLYFFDEKTNWTNTHSYYIDNKDWPKHYLLSLNWSLNIMYSNFNAQPTSKVEIGFTCLCMIVSCIGFGYIVSSIGSLLSEIDKEQKEYKQDLNILNQYMKRKQIDIGLVRRVNIQLKKYYDQKRRVNYLEERNSLLKLNEYMSKELHIAANNKILKQFPLFSQIFSEQTNMKICMIMQERLYSPNQVIYDSKNNQEKESQLYLIVKGSVAIENPFSIDDKKVINNLSADSSNIFPYHIEEEQQKYQLHLKKNDCFGQIGFFTGREEITKASSIKYTTIITINRKEMIEIISENKNEYEKFMEIKDTILHQNDLFDLKIPCMCCQQFNHSTFYCPSTHYSKDPYFLCSGNNNHQKQERQNNIIRNQKNKFHPLNQQFVVHETAYKFAIDYGLFNVFEDIIEEGSQQIENEDIFGPQIQTTEYIPKQQQTSLQKTKIKINNQIENHKSPESHKDIKMDEITFQADSRRDWFFQNFQTQDRCSSFNKVVQLDEENNLNKEKQNNVSIKALPSQCDPEQYQETSEQGIASQIIIPIKPSKRCSIDQDIQFQRSLSNLQLYSKNNEMIARNLSNGLYEQILQYLNKETNKLKYQKNSATNRVISQKQYQQIIDNKQYQGSQSQLNDYEEVIQRRQQKKQATILVNKSVNQKQNIYSISQSNNICSSNNNNNNNNKQILSQNLQQVDSDISEEIFLNDMDIQFQFVNYFPRNNMKNVLKQYEQYQSKVYKLKSKQQKKTRGVLILRRQRTISNQNKNKPCILPYQ